ncbi:protein kinase [Streptomyces sp. NPDC051016]|uniref:serine/threonine-protein kinase n=1 Tax=Streptomyces sp. NPDC051016 TaxID=3365638 RepID=UPI00379EE1D3
MLNEVLAGRFRITGLLGSGGMGRVWAAEDERMRREVAVKIVHPQHGMDEAETQARFQREVQLVGRLAHRNIVTVHDWGEASVDGRPTLFLVMELVQGESLHRRLKASPPGWPLAAGWAAQIAEALHAAHGQGVVHRDIKPANALLTPEGTVKVLDFGVAKFMGETMGARDLTVTGTPVGSPSYMSPEQADGDKTIDHRSDLYSLGCLLYHAVAGRPPFTGSTQWAVLRKQLQDTPEPPGSRVEGLPAALNDLILALLAKAPDDRPADAAAVYETLSDLLADHALTQPDGNIQAVTQLGHLHSVSGRILMRAWELFQWTERIREEADHLLADARRDADTTRKCAEELRERIADEAEALHEQARREATEVEKLTGARCDALIIAAEEQLAEARTKAKDLVSAAGTEASRLRLNAVRKAEGLLKEAEDKKRTLIRAGEELRAQVMHEAGRTVEARKRELEILAGRREDINAEIERIAVLTGAQWSEDDYYRLFRRLIDGGYPTSYEFGVNVKAAYGVMLPAREADRMVSRFVNRHTAELQEDHIA